MPFLYDIHNIFRPLRSLCPTTLRTPPCQMQTLHKQNPYLVMRKWLANNPDFRKGDSRVRNASHESCFLPASNSNCGGERRKWNYARSSRPLLPPPAPKWCRIAVSITLSSRRDALSARLAASNRMMPLEMGPHCTHASVITLPLATR